MPRFKVKMAVVGHRNVVVTVEVEAELRSLAVAKATRECQGIMVPDTLVELESIREIT